LNDIANAEKISKRPAFEAKADYLNRFGGHAAARSEIVKNLMSFGENKYRRKTSRLPLLSIQTATGGRRPPQTKTPACAEAPPQSQEKFDPARL
jgi:hypothetical protein